MSKFVVRGLDADGHQQVDADSVFYMIFCPAMQEWLPTKFPTRQIAEFMREFYENRIEYYAVTEFANIKLYRLDSDERLWGGNGRVAPVATFTNVEAFERFVGKTLREFNGVPC